MAEIKRKRRTPEEIAADKEATLIHTVRTGLKKINEAALQIGTALNELRGAPDKWAPKRDLTTEEWDTFLQETFGITQPTAAKFIALAKYEAPQLEGGYSIWNKLPPSWTTQYQIVSKMKPAQLKEAIESGDITPVKTGPQIAEVIRKFNPRQPRGNKGKTDPKKVKVEMYPWEVGYLLHQAAQGESKLTDDDIKTLGEVLAKLLLSKQREAIRDLLADR